MSRLVDGGRQDLAFLSFIVLVTVVDSGISVASMAEDAHILTLNALQRTQSLETIAYALVHDIWPTDEDNNSSTNNHHHSNKADNVQEEFGVLLRKKVARDYGLAHWYHPAHSTGRSQSMDFRAAVALQVHFGHRVRSGQASAPDCLIIAMAHNQKCWTGGGADSVHWYAAGYDGECNNSDPVSNVATKNSGSWRAWNLEYMKHRAGCALAAWN
jgi:hypothetical protein